MSEKLNLSTSAYCKIEYGETELTLIRLSQIAEILAIPIGELFNRIIAAVQLYPPKEGKSIDNAQNTSPAKEREQEYNDDLRNLMKAHSLLIDMICKRMDSIEKEFRNTQQPNSSTTL